MPSILIHAVCVFFISVGMCVLLLRDATAREAWALLCLAASMLLSLTCMASALVFFEEAGALVHLEHALY
jgi:uncharacterized membrane protein YhaH (DUF805 family)